ncbi:hypothetical protein D1R32_gp297 [Tunisvirus fontaine2]|uniref:Uncharacterized protein n=1 Tax=Tunisvirus fontaine2 TaxID=1421067 RepID=V9SGJ8_9VIRU|nr:hypothetical protein D1R32_gp297 [Tunisvirus fontaine2]AHC55014.1 hypothetical protein TNS_ORF296 [Tunisvirus fontaine2]
MSSSKCFLPDLEMLNWILILFVVAMIVWLVFFRKPSAVQITEGYTQEDQVLEELKKLMMCADKSGVEMTEAEFENASNDGRIQMMVIKEDGVTSGKDGPKKEGYAYYFPVGSSGYPMALYTSLYDYAPRSINFSGWRFLKTARPVWDLGRWRLFNGVWVWTRS